MYASGADSVPVPPLAEARTRSRSGPRRPYSDTGSLVRGALLPVLCALAIGSARPARATEDGGGDVSATMTCERAASGGRVRCDVEARAAQGASISWGDVAVLQVPAFAAA